MQKMNITDVLGIKNPIRDVIYLIKDQNDESIYSGMAKESSVSDRIVKHIGDVHTNEERSSKISKLLLQKHPNYFSWTVIIFNKEDVEEHTGKNNICCLQCAERELHDYEAAKQNCTLLIGNARKPNRCKPVAR